MPTLVVGTVPVPARVVSGVTVSTASVTVSAADVPVCACLMPGMSVPEQRMGAGVVTAQRSVITMFAAGVVSDLPGHHAENHVAETEHGADYIKSSKRS